MSRLISLDEVKRHRDDKSTWIVIHNEVYDVTKFLNEHPGGAESLLEVAGQDGTQQFEDVGHSEDAREQMLQFKIGALPAEERTINVETCSGRWKWALLALAGAIIIGITMKKYMGQS